ncbi:MAG TPA: aminotransferase class IV [Propionibacteriaceae bacterium]|nr:aminotransferase class IV [Propionibacteriaceae bacterium]
MQLTASVPQPLTGQLRIWLNGRLYDDPQQASIAGTDHGLLVGDGVFETLKVTERGAFAVRRHLDRLSRSAAALSLPAPDHGQIREAIEAVLAGRDFPRARLRITYTGGRGPLGSEAAYGPPTLIVALVPADAAAPQTSIVTAPWTRNEHGALAGVKSTSYAENVRGLEYAAQHQASEAIFLNTAGHVCEGTGTNIFVVFGDTVVTPPLSAGPLAGITRELIMEWTPVAERDLTLNEAQEADEVFLTSSMRDTQGVERWDDQVFDPVRPVTQALAATFAARSETDLDP